MKSLRLNKPHLIIMVGIPGAGKSFFAQHFAETFNAPLVSFECIHKKIFQASVLSKDETETVCKISDYILKELFKTRQTVIFDGVSHSRTARLELAKESKKNNYEPFLVWVQTEKTTARTRAVKYSRGKSPMSSDLFEQQVKQFTPPSSNEKVIVISGMHTYASQLKIVLKKLAEPRIQLENQSGIKRAEASSRYVNLR
jgi:hypothetical protein